MIRHYSKKAWFYPLIIFLAALLVKLTYFWFIKNDPLVQLPILDALVYSQWGREIASGNLLARAPYWTEPGYAYFLALCIKLGLSSGAIILFQFILGSLSAVLLFLSAN